MGYMASGWRTFIQQEGTDNLWISMDNEYCLIHRTEKLKRQLKLQRIPRRKFGIDKVYGPSGVRIKKIYDEPGQPGLELNDYLIKINGEDLLPGKGVHYTPGHQRSLLKKNRENGVPVLVRREKWYLCKITREKL